MEVLYNAISLLVTEPGDIKSRLLRARAELRFLNSDQFIEDFKKRWTGINTRLNNIENNGNNENSALAGQIFSFWMEYRIEMHGRPGNI